MKMSVEEIRDDWENFPVGLRVLAVDDDPICLKLLETQLRKCQYHVTATSQARMALNLLRENKSRFDLVISDVYMPDMDGFKLLELVGLEMDLPVIMLSANGNPKLVMKGVTHGACDYLVKPVRIEELRNIWQHVIRKKRIDPKNQNKSSDQSKDREENGQGSPLTRNTDHNGKSNRKRKDEEYESDDNGNESEDAGTQKKPRVVWSIDLHRKFVAAVNQLGIEKAVPKRILDMMNVDGLTRENVASHLQKYRLYLKRISTVASQQANMAAALGIKNSPFMHMGSLDGLGDYRTLSGPRLSNVTLSPFTSNGMLGRLNSPTNVNLHNLNPSPMIQTHQPGNLTSSLSSLGKKHLVLPPSVNQNTANLFQGIPSSLEIDNNGTSHFNTLDGAGFFTNVGTFSDLGAVLGSSRNLLNNNNNSAQQVLNGVRGFGNPSAHEITNINSESFNDCSSNLLDPVKCNDSWQNAIDSSKMHQNNHLLPTEGFSNNNSSNGTCFPSDPIGFSSGMALVTSEGRPDYGHGPINNINNNNYGSLNSIVSTLGRNFDQNNGILNKKMENIFVNGRLSGSGWTLVENERFDMGLRARSGDDFLVEQPKLQVGVGRQGYDSLDELMNAMIKREHDDTIPNCDFGLDDYSFGQAI